mmetsp:Transcript_56299/g.138164  ORF Transcript_56299/g.138164 Transcript_56299/m.138164 type:complete len:251 (-) Transcript_56299:877-1629(-)
MVWRHLAMLVRASPTIPLHTLSPKSMHRLLWFCPQSMRGSALRLIPPGTFLLDTACKELLPSTKRILERRCSSPEKHPPQIQSTIPAGIPWAQQSPGGSSTSQGTACTRPGPARAEKFLLHIPHKRQTPPPPASCPLGTSRTRSCPLHLRRYRGCKERKHPSRGLVLPSPLDIERTPRLSKSPHTHCRFPARKHGMPGPLAPDGIWPASPKYPRGTSCFGSRPATSLRSEGWCPPARQRALQHVRRSVPA